MASCFRRVLAARSSLLFLRSPCMSRSLLRFQHSLLRISTPGNPAVGMPALIDRFAFESCFGDRRGFAKGRKSKGDDDGDTVVFDVGPTVKSTVTSQMEAAVDSLSRELSKLRTGRASAGMLDHIIVELNNAKMPLNRVAVVSVLDAKTLSVTPYDPNALKSLHTAIVSSPLGLNPTDDGQRLIAVIPPLTKENVQALCKVVSKHAEDVKQSIRRARQKGLDSIKKSGSSIAKDDLKRLEKEVDEITKRFVKSADDMCKAKEKEITGS